MKTLKKILLIPLFAVVCTFARIDSARAVTVPGVTYPFSITTTSIAANGTFQFFLSAKGTFYVDCGSGGTLSSDDSTANGMISGGTISKTNTTRYKFKCTYSSAGTKTIQFGGTATAYNTSSTSLTISFNSNQFGANNDANVALISSISGDLSAVFPYLGSGSGQQPSFIHTFQGAKNLTSIPATLFSSLTGVGQHMFYYTFSNSGITSIPENLFNFGGNNVSGKFYIFAYTFEYCTSLTSIPANLFQRVTSSEDDMFASTFRGCSSLTSIPETLFNFGGNNVSGQSYMFSNTFADCTGITSIPANLFQRVTSAADGMFYYTFGDCTGITSIPENLFNFGGNSVSGQTYMFHSTFYGCTGLTFLPENLFQRVTSAANRMFYQTFYGCTNITRYIPTTTFAGLIANGHPIATDMWSGTFTNTQLVTSCPSGTAQYITGYEGTDATTTWNGKISCSGTPSPIPVSYSCGNGSGTPPASTTATYAVPFTTAANTCTAPKGNNFSEWLCGTTSVNAGATITIMEDTTCTAQYYAFSITTTNISTAGKFEFQLSAQGTFYVDCGAGGTLGSDNSTANGMISGGIISKTDTTSYTFRCYYSSAGTRTIKFNGAATAYNTGTSTAAIRFSSASSVSSISGDLSAVFPYLGSGSGQQPRFYYTFSGATKLTSIPATLFGSLTGSVTYMFQYTFYNCTGLTSIPETLFNFGGNNVLGRSNMFYRTFYGCTGLTSLPANLFSHITIVALRMFYQTFYGCTGLTGYIPPSMFSGLIANGSPYSGSDTSGTMYQTFYNTGSLATTCPSGTTQYITGYESYWDGHVSCGAPITCSSGYYLPANTSSCATCPSGKTCPGGTFGFNALSDQGFPVNLTWYDGNSTISGPTSCAVGGVFLPPTPPARTGYIFNGWKIKSVNP